MLQSTSELLATSYTNRLAYKQLCSTVNTRNFDNFVVDKPLLDVKTCDFIHLFENFHMHMCIYRKVVNRVFSLFSCVFFRGSHDSVLVDEDERLESLNNQTKKW